MKEFNLKEYLENPSKKVITRDGSAVKIHCTNFNSCQPIIAEIEGHNYSRSFTKDGRYYVEDRNSPYDLFFAPTKHTDYINLYRNGGCYFLGGGVYTSEENAKYIADRDNQYITTIKVECEE